MTPLHMPPALSQGSRVALVAPARWANAASIDRASQQLTDWGFEAVVPDPTRLRDHQFGGTTPPALRL